MSWAFAVGVVLLFIGLLASIALHEIGHLVPAKIFGVRCPQYMVGFGPTLWSVRRGETEYGIKAIPLGGYVRMIGMLPPKPDGTLRQTSTGMFQGVVDSARDAAAQEIRPGEEHRVFYRMAWWKKVIVMVGGPAMNFLLAILFFAILLMGFGTYVSQPVVSSVSDCVIPASEGERPCRSGDPAAPAKGKLREDDRLVSFNGTPIESWGHVTKLIRDNGAGSVVLGVERGGEHVRVPVTLVASERPVLDDPDRTVRVGFLGVTPTPERVRQGPGAVAAFMGDATARVGNMVLHLPQRMAAVWDAAFGGGEREKDGPIGVVGASRLGGEIAELEAPPSDKIATFIGLLGGINLALGVINLIPLLPFDGGHVAGALWEGLKRGFARVVRRPQPPHVDIAKALPLTYAMALILIGMSVLLVYADLVNPVRLSG